MRDNVGKFCRCHAACQPLQFFSGNIDIHQHPGNFTIINGHGLFNQVRVQMMACYKFVQNVEVLFGLAIQTDNPPALDCSGRCGIIRAFEDRKPGLGVFFREKIKAEHSVVPIGKTPPAIGVRGVGHGLSPCCDAAPIEQRGRCILANCATVTRLTSELDAFSAIYDQRMTRHERRHIGGKKYNSI